jgi:WD40 repeat protein
MPLLATLCLINPLILRAQELNNNFAVSSFENENSSNSSAQQVVAKPELILQTGYNSSLGADRLMFSPDGRLLATTTLGSSVIKLWETSTGRELRNLQSGIQNAPGTSPVVAFSRTSRLLATVGVDNLVRIWDVVSARELQTLAQTELAAQSEGVHFITFGIDDRTLLTVSDAIRVWDVITGREIRPEQNIVPSLARGAAVSPDGRQLAVIMLENSQPLVRVFDLESVRKPQSINLPNNSIANAQLSFTSNGTLLISAIREGRLQLLDLTAGGRERQMCRPSGSPSRGIRAPGRRV